MRIRSEFVCFADSDSLFYVESSQKHISRRDPIRRQIEILKEKRRVGQTVRLTSVAGNVECCCQTGQIWRHLLRTGQRSINILFSQRNNYLYPIGDQGGQNGCRGGSTRAPPMTVARHCTFAN